MPNSAPRQLPVNGLSRFGFGCVKLGGSRTSGGDRRRIKLVHEAIDCGVTFFDTADAYGSGRSEAILGLALGRRRSEVVLATKGGYRFREVRLDGFRSTAFGQPIAAAWQHIRENAKGTPYSVQDFSATYLRDAVDASLRRLRTDHIDLYQLHAPREMCDEATFAALDELVRSGKVGQIGVGFESTSGADRWLDIDVVQTFQLPFGILDPEAGTTLLPAAAGRGVSVIARGVLASGLLNADVSAIGLHMDRQKSALLEELRAVAMNGNLTMNDLALSWVLAQPLAGKVLVGIDSSAHLQSMIRAAVAPRPDEALMASVDGLLGAYLQKRASH